MKPMILMRIRTVILVLGTMLNFAVRPLSAADSNSGHSQLSVVATAIPKDQRHNHQPTQPDVPQPQKPTISTPDNIDTDLPIYEWEHLSGDWGGARPWLDDHGIVIESSIVSDWSSNVHGGQNTNGSSFRHLFMFDVTVDTERLFSLPGGTIFMNFQNHNGEDGSGDTGDFQAYSNVDSDGRTQIAELWYEQEFFEGLIRVKIGKVDANAEFAYVDHGGEFLNSSMGSSPTVFVLPTYPDPSMALVVFVYPADNVYTGVGVFDGAAVEGITTGTRGPGTFFDSSPADMFVIGETGVTWQYSNSRLPGRFGVGGWGHTGSFKRFDDTTSESGTAGFYLVFDQTVFLENPADEDDEQGVGVFLQFGWADGDVSEAQLHIGGGVVWTGLIPSRDDDAAGLGITYVKFTDESAAGFTGDAETAFEFFYKAQIMPWLAFKPDLQYILNPGGADLKDALVGTVRVEVVF